MNSKKAGAKKKKSEAIPGMSTSTSLLLLSQLPMYQDLFSPEDRALIANKGRKTLIIKGLYHPAHLNPSQEKSNYDYLLPLDLSKREAQAFIARLKSSDSENSPLQQDLIERYKQNAWEKIEAMFIAFDKFQEDRSKEHLEFLKMESHKIAGSALSYGFKSLGEVCRSLDQFLSSSHSEDEIIANCLSSLRKMLFAYQKIEL